MQKRLSFRWSLLVYLVLQQSIVAQSAWSGEARPCTIDGNSIPNVREVEISADILTKEREESYYQSLKKIAKALAVSMPEDQLHKAAHNFATDGASALSFEVSLEGAAVAGLVYGKELLIAPNRNDPSKLRVAIFEFSGGQFGPKYGAGLGTEYNFIFNLKKMDDYAGGFAGLDGNIGPIGVTAFCSGDWSTPLKDRVCSFGLGLTPVGAIGGVAAVKSYYYKRDEFDFDPDKAGESIKKITADLLELPKLK